MRRCGQPNPPGGYLATVLRVVVVLLGQHEDQLKGGLSMDGSPHLAIGYLRMGSPECMCRRVGLWA